MKTFGAFTICIALLVAAHTAHAAGNTTLSVSATVASKNVCNFKTPSANLNFGTLDPLNPVNVAATATATFRCMGSAPTVVYFIDQDYGLYETGPGANRMQHISSPTTFLPYTLSISPQTGSFPKETPPVDHIVTITGQIQGVDYQTALAGNYTDTVVLTINP